MWPLQKQFIAWSLTKQNTYQDKERFVVDFLERFHFIFAFINKKHTLFGGSLTIYYSNNFNQIHSS